MLDKYPSRTFPQAWFKDKLLSIAGYIMILWTITVLQL